MYVYVKVIVYVNCDKVTSITFVYSNNTVTRHTQPNLDYLSKYALSMNTIIYYIIIHTMHIITYTYCSYPIIIESTICSCVCIQ